MDPFENTMLLSTLYWPDEIRVDRASSTCPRRSFEFKPAEKQMAEQLVEAMTGEFDPAKYQDEYREALMQVIEAKVEGARPSEVERARGGRQARRPHGRARGERQGRRRPRASSEKPVSVAEAKEKRAAARRRPTTRRRSRPLDVAARRRTRSRRRPRRPVGAAGARAPDAALPMTGPSAGRRTIRCFPSADRQFRAVVLRAIEQLGEAASPEALEATLRERYTTARVSPQDRARLVHRRGRRLVRLPARLAGDRGRG